ncbi:DNA replication complex GINS protein PSF1-like isoform X1 [Anopheles funestus]|uniref:DNA replication complex GINS protein PSF1-like isoform X1 n=1 Tax=Anopheles funestus TaxID=62324 RepID=UPI0020C72DB2|nr:DNA replication complex GINS protein PSF1-like isoform X1 [Anopheles funestus]
MSTDKGFELIREFERSTDPIPAFNVCKLVCNVCCVPLVLRLLFDSVFQDDGVRSVLEDISKIYQENYAHAITFNETGDRKFLPLVMYRHNLIKRQKRCVLAYLANRLFRLKRLRWHVGPILPAEIKACINEPESIWFNKYSRILAEYMASIHDGYGLNLTNDIKPPKSLYIEVRCLTDYGKFELENGEIILLKKNSQHYLPKLQCEQLIRQGILQHIT